MVPPSPSAVLLLDEHHRVVRANEHAACLLGFPSSNALIARRAKLSDLVVEPFELGAFGEPRTASVRRYNAPEVVVQMEVSSLVGEAGEAWAVVMRDVDAPSSRATAHDLKNALMGILGNIELAKLAVDDRTVLIERLDNADLALRRATALAQAGKERARPPGGVRVLLMDDDPVVRDVLTEMLEQLGCRVTTVEDGLAAVAAYRRSMVEEDAYGAVILDLTVERGMGGEETARLLRDIDVHVHAVATSGSVFDPAMVDPAEHGFARAMVKPFSLVDLERVLAEIKTSG
jgi:CheY-like chemotaxis protein